MQTNPRASPFQNSFNLSKFAAWSSTIVSGYVSRAVCSPGAPPDRIQTSPAIATLPVLDEEWRRHAMAHGTLYVILSIRYAVSD